MQEIDQRDRELLNVLQGEVPLASTPYAILGQMIDMSEKEVLKRCERLRRDGSLKQISGVFDSRALGFRTCLVAARVDGEDIERAASVINMHPGVSQNYKRNHDFNLWFTIAIPPNSRLGLERTVDILGEEAGAEVVRMLPTLKLFKSTSGDSSESLHESAPSDEKREPLTEGEIEVVRVLQRDLPLQPRPFDAVAKTINLSGEEFLDIARSMQKRNQLRRFSATVQLRRPFVASAMGVWAVPEERADEIAKKMVSHKSVSQCYLRPTYEDWPYNIFTTVHGRSVDECEAVLQEIAEETEITQMRALFPMKEFKRSRLALFAPEFDAWEGGHLGNRAETAVS